MHPRSIFHFIGLLVLFLGLSMAAPLAVSLVFQDGSTESLALSMGVAVTAGLLLSLATRSREDVQLSHRDGAAVVSLGWASAGLVGTLPYLLSGAVPGLTNAYFESLSGFTTTGASILSNIEALPEGILLWRSLTQWFGGMGIIVLSVAILPFLGIGGMQLYKAEVPSPVVDKLKPRISETAKTLWKIYILFTGMEILLLLGGGMPLFESACHAFCTMPTGGFSPMNASIAHYDSSYFDGVILVFMLVAGVNFSLHYRFLKGETRIVAKDPELLTFLGLFAVFTLAVTLDIYGSVYQSLSGAFRYASFQVGSILTTTGFATADFDQWPACSRLILLCSMFVGGMAGSTGGGIKIMRIVLLAKHAYREVLRIIHPHAVISVKLGRTPVGEDVLSSVWGFFLLFLGLFIVSTLVMAALGLDLITAFSSVAASIGNTGPGLGAVGPVRNYLGIPDAGKWVLIFCMLLGRLEVYTVILLLVPAFWRK
ncbi:MAG: TrkH family potassium uptake protein [Deltaproteobacteria bacterium]|nr:TrkH family potassium uptake protein [Deltaproteobacteria bacterium]